MSASGGRTSVIDPIRVGKASPFLADTSMASVVGRKHIDFNKSPENFTHAARALMYAYVMAPAADPIERTRRILEAARAHISTVAYYSRLSAAAGGAFGRRIMDVEISIMSEWVRILHREPLLGLSDAITIVSRNATICPASHEFRNPVSNTPNSNGEAKGTGGICNTRSVFG